MAAAWLAAHALAGLAPLRWAWGLAAWSFYPAPVQGALAAAGALALAWGWGGARSGGRPRGDRARPEARGGAGAASGASHRPADSRAILGLLPAAALLFWLLRARTHFLGDGYARLVAADPHGVYKTPLDYLLNYELAGRLGWLLGGGLERGAAALSVLAGAVVVALLPGLVRGAGVPRGARLAAGAALFLSAWALLFFGYVEVYPVYLALELLLVWAGLRVAGRWPASLWLVPAWLAAVACHFQAVLLLPAVAYAVGASRPRVAGGAGAPGTPGRARAIVLGAGAVLVLAAVVLAGRLGLTGHALGVAGFLAEAASHSLARTFASRSAAGFFLAGRVNEWLLVWGAAVTLVPVALAGARAARGPGLDAGAPKPARGEAAPPLPVGRFLALAAAGGLVALLYSGLLGSARDWDLGGASLVPAQLWLIARAARSLAPAIRRPVLAATAALGLLHAAPWVALQCDAPRGGALAAALAREGPAVMALSVHERGALGQFLIGCGRDELAAGVLEGSPRPSAECARLYVEAAAVRARLGQQPAAAADCARAWQAVARGPALELLVAALRAQPDLAVAEALGAPARAAMRVDRLGLARRPAEALAAADSALVRWPREPLLLRRRALALAALGRPAEALAQARGAAEADTTYADAWHDLALLYRLAGRARESQAAADRAAARPFRMP